MTRTLELFFGDKVNLHGDEHPCQQVENVSPLFDMADDVVIVRVYQGIHFRTADAVARRQGTRAADWAFSHYLRLSTDDEGSRPVV